MSEGGASWGQPRADEADHGSRVAAAGLRMDRFTCWTMIRWFAPGEKIESTEQKLPMEAGSGVFERPITAASIAVYRVVSLPSDGTRARCPRSGPSCTVPYLLHGKNQRPSREHREDVPVGQIVEE